MVTAPSQPTSLRLDGLIDQTARPLEIADVVGVRCHFAAHALDLVDHLLGWAGVAALAVHRTAEVVHHDQCAAAGHQQRVLTPEATSRAGDDRYLAVESEISHGLQR